MRVAIVTFPGSNCDYDCYHALTDVVGVQADYVWHRETSLGDADAVILPGGFSYGDYLRAGAIARFSPIMAAVLEFAKSGGPVTLWQFNPLYEFRRFTISRLQLRSGLRPRHEERARAFLKFGLA